MSRVLQVTTAKTMHESGGRQQAIDSRKDPNGVQATPLLGHWQINRKNACLVAGHERVKPARKGQRAYTVTPMDGFDAPANLPECQDTQE
jgi:hypothetical protein